MKRLDHFYLAGLSLRYGLSSSIGCRITRGVEKSDVPRPFRVRYEGRPRVIH